MQSETGNQSQNFAPIASRLAGVDIQRKMADGDSILDFVAKNSPGYKPAVADAKQEIQADLDKAAVVHAEEPPKSPLPEIVPDVQNEEPLEEPVVEEPAEGEPAESPENEDEGDEELELKGTAPDNFKKLRAKVKELKVETSKKDSALQELTKELEAYVKGEKIPDEIAKREARIAELEHYEKLLDLKKSRYYQENFVEPLENIKNRLSNTADMYEVSLDKLYQAANMEDEAVLNRFLSNNFDLVGANEVKQIIKDYKAIQRSAAEAEKAPVEALNNMIEKAKAARAEQHVKRLEVMQDISRGAWIESLNYIKDEGKIRELTYKEGDIEHNEKIFKPIVKAAATEYGKLVNQLAKNGLESLPKPLAYALSRLCQLAHASAVAIDSRERAVSHAEAVAANSKRTQRYIRPSVSGAAGTPKTNGNRAGVGGGPSSPLEAAESLLSQVRGH